MFVGGETGRKKKCECGEKSNFDRCINDECFLYLHFSDNLIWWLAVCTSELTSVLFNSFLTCEQCYLLAKEWFNIWKEYARYHSHLHTNHEAIGRLQSLCLG